METIIFIDSPASKRIKDENGFLIIKDNPIAKAGVFDYLLSEVKNDIDKADEKIVKVYRPFDELVRIKDSFQNKPIKFTHLWVGNENKTADGAIGSNIRADEKTGMLYADLIIYNPDLISAIENDKIVELSPAYTGSVVAEYGRNNGVGYEFRQNLNCINHLAVVERGRSGSDLRIADQAFNDERERDNWNKWDEKANTYSEKADEISAQIKEMGTIVSPQGKRKLESLKRKEQEYRKKAQDLWDKADTTADKSENQTNTKSEKSAKYNPTNVERDGNEKMAIGILNAILGKRLTSLIVAKYDESKGRIPSAQNTANSQAPKENTQNTEREIKGDDLKENDIKRDGKKASAENESTGGKKGNPYRSDTGQFSSEGKGKKIGDERMKKVLDTRLKLTILQCFSDAITWRETDHPRDEKGRFSSGGSGSKLASVRAESDKFKSKADKRQSEKQDPMEIAKKIKKLNEQLTHYRQVMTKDKNSFKREGAKINYEMTKKLIEKLENEL